MDLERTFVPPQRLSVALAHSSARLFFFWHARQAASFSDVTSRRRALSGRSSSGSVASSPSGAYGCAESVARLFAHVATGRAGVRRQMPQHGEIGGLLSPCGRVRTSGQHHVTFSCDGHGLSVCRRFHGHDTQFRQTAQSASNAPIVRQHRRSARGARGARLPRCARGARGARSRLLLRCARGARFAHAANVSP